jgi:acyl dehydratase
LTDPTPGTPAAHPTIRAGGDCQTSIIEGRSFAVGDEAPVLTHELKRSDLIRYAGASGDFFPLHTDDAYARDAGFDGIFAHGMYSAGLLVTAITNWLGVGALRRLKVRFAAKAWPGEVLSSRVRITATRSDNGTLLVDFDCTLSDVEGTLKIRGSGTAAPSHDISRRDSARTPRS